MNNLKSKFALAILLSALAGQVMADRGQENGERGGKRKGPPPEAIEACANLQEGDTVSFEPLRGDTLEATCEIIEDQLVAVPQRHKRRPKN